MHRTETKESFIAKAKARYDNFYDYSKVEYVNQSIKVIIVCPNHGDFERTPTYHLQGGGCPVCAKIRQAEYWTPERRAEKSRQMSLPETLAKRAVTTQARYGSPVWATSDAARALRDAGEGPWSQAAFDKARETCIERFGAKTWAESEVGRRQARERCADESVRQKMSEVASSPEVREKVRQTSREHFGADHWTQSESGRAKLHAMFSTDEERARRSERMLSESVRAKIQATSMARYGVPYYWQSDVGRARLRELLNSEAVLEKTRETNLRLYGAETWQGSEIGRAVLGSDSVQGKRRETCRERYGAAYWPQSNEGRAVLGSDATLQKIHDTRKANGSYRRSQPEDALYELLRSVFGESDVCRQYHSDVYPFDCDFYVRSLDLFIELNAFWMHNGHWFDENDVSDLEQVQLWCSIDKPMYERAVYIWTESDPKKRARAAEMDLNYVVFWNNDLSDAKAWISSGCPIRKDWS